jgi:hypothetical protein
MEFSIKAVDYGINTLECISFTLINKSFSCPFSPSLMNLAEIIYSIYMYLPLSTLPYNNMDKDQ